MAGDAVNWLWFLLSEDLYYFEIEVKIYGIMYFGAEPLDILVWNMFHLKVNYE